MWIVKQKIENKRNFFIFKNISSPFDLPLGLPDLSSLFLPEKVGTELRVVGAFHGSLKQLGYSSTRAGDIINKS